MILFLFVNSTYRSLSIHAAGADKADADRHATSSVLAAIMLVAAVAINKRLLTRHLISS